MDGTDEGLFSWFTVNFLLGNLAVKVWDFMTYFFLASRQIWRWVRKHRRCSWPRWWLHTSHFCARQRWGSSHYGSWSRIGARNQCLPPKTCCLHSQVIILVRNYNFERLHYVKSSVATLDLAWWQLGTEFWTTTERATQQKSSVLVSIQLWRRTGNMVEPPTT